MLVPTLIGMLAQHPKLGQYDLSTLRTAFYGSMPMPPAILSMAVKAFPNVQFNQLYGSTEAGMLGVLPWSEHAAHGHTAGREALLSEVRIVNREGRDVAVGEIGEVLGHRYMGMVGYWRNEKATAETIRGD